MRVHRRSHRSGYDKDNFALHDGIRQRVRYQEARGMSFDTSFLHASIEFASIPVVLEDLYLFFSRRYVSTLFERFPRSRDTPESGINFIFDLAMQ